MPTPVENPNSDKVEELKNQRLKYIEDHQHKSRQLWVTGRFSLV